MTQMSHYQLVASHYGIDRDLLKAEKAIYTKFVTDHTHPSGSQATAAGVVETVYKNDLHGVLPVFKKIIMFCRVLLQRPQTKEDISEEYNGSNATKQSGNTKY